MTLEDPRDGGLEAAPRSLLARLAGRPWAADFYLAGGAAIGWHLARDSKASARPNRAPDRRPARDLDLMSATNRLAGPDRRDLLADLLAVDSGVRVETARDGYLFVRAPAGPAAPQRPGAGPGVRLFWYPYPLVDPLAEDPATGFAVASLADLGLMKIAAIISRAARRDFVDLFHLVERLPLEVLLDRSTEKFGHVRDFPLQALKALADFSDAETDPPLAVRPGPGQASALRWEEVRAFFETEVRRLGRIHVGLGLAPGGAGEA